MSIGSDGPVADKASTRPDAPAKRRSSRSRSSENPIRNSIELNVSLPAIEVKMLNASSLADYEVWLFVASVTSSTSVGFLVAYFQSLADKDGGADIAMLVSAIIFGVIFVVTFGRAMGLRKSISKEAKSVRMQATEIEGRDLIA
ncbi:hypothetical protein [Micromonospora noduli]|uniref:hypothetical protein n=1 Tax=Micromonospora noduli TaxID=709876 RepID=UPI0011BF44CD|nr:hypothetical protein [Micromonospora noduli]